LEKPEIFPIKESDGVEIISLVDNIVDFLSSIDKKEVHSIKQRVKVHSQFPFAEHGFSMFIRIKSGETKRSILFDTGCSSQGLIENSARLNVNLDETDCIVLSHGHWDHISGLQSALKAIGKADLPIVIHEDMFKIRGVVNQDGVVSKYPEPLEKVKLKDAKLVETKQPFLVADDLALVTGEIPRVASYEKGYAKHRASVGGVWQLDQLILDDRALVINVKGKGLVVLSGCAHAGIINTIRYAQRITGIMDIYAVMGGFHLAGKGNENRIEETVNELKKINPTIIVPSHCTGWRGMFAIANALPRAFIYASVGNLYNI
jgi:7,8-dihydropterin-6-yl-methyl-4-(beta-D-ribofuranosyl)aminobenzene 5'-phosphate synthase